MSEDCESEGEGGRGTFAGSGEFVKDALSPDDPVSPMPSGSLLLVSMPGVHESTRVAPATTVCKHCPLLPQTLTWAGLVSQTDRDLVLIHEFHAPRPLGRKGRAVYLDVLTLAT